MKKSYKINYFKEIDSTNAYALRNLAELSDKQIIVADKQTAGKGRLNRSWISNRENNVYLSIALKPCDKVNNNLPLVNLTQYMSVVICKILEKYGVTPEIKWANDVLVDGKKIAGILAQSSIQGEVFKGLVLGVGINLNLSQEDIQLINQPATSLNLILGNFVDRDRFIEQLLDDFFENYDAFLNQGFSFIKKEYTDRINFLNKKISVTVLDCIENGIAKEIADDGSLLLLTENMEQKVITMGDICINESLY